MELAKSLFKPSIHEGYAGKEDKIYIESAVSDDEDARRPNSSAAEEYDNEKTNVAEFLATFKPLKEGPFSAVTPSLCPQDILTQLQENEQTGDSRYDEFGFHLDECRLEFFRTNKLSEEPFVEDSQWRLQWIVQLNFDKGDEISWENVEVVLPHTDKFASMVRKGIPHSLRHQLWMRFNGSLEKKLKAKTPYREVVKLGNFDEFITSHQIEKDVYRTLPGNACFNSERSTGVPRLRRILRGITFFFNDIGYCQGMGVIVGYLLLFMEEEDAFWMMVSIMEDLIPATYFTANIPGVMADVKLIRSLLITYIPSIHEALVTHDVDITVILVSWLLPAFGNVLHIKVLLRIWDLFFFHGSIILIRVCFGILKLIEDQIANAEDGVAILNALTDAPGYVDDIEKLLQVSFEVSADLTDELLVNERKRHQAYLMVDRGTILGSPEAITNLPKQQLSRFKRIFSSLFSNFYRAMFGCMTCSSPGGRSVIHLHVL